MVDTAATTSSADRTQYENGSILDFFKRKPADASASAASVTADQAKAQQVAATPAQAPQSAAGARLQGSATAAAAPLVAAIPATPAPAPLAPNQIAGPFVRLATDTSAVRAGLQTQLDALPEEDRSQRPAIARRIDWMGDFFAVSRIFAYLAEGRGPTTVPFKDIGFATPLSDIAASFAVLANPLQVAGSPSKMIPVSETDYENGVMITRDQHEQFQFLHRQWVERLGLEGYFSADFEFSASGQTFLTTLPQLLAYLELSASRQDQRRMEAFKAQVQEMHIGDVYQMLNFRLATAQHPVLPKVELCGYALNTDRTPAEIRPSGEAMEVSWLQKDGRPVLGTAVGSHIVDNDTIVAARAYKALFELPKGLAENLKAIDTRLLKGSVKAAIQTLQDELDDYKAIADKMAQGTMSWAALKQELSSVADRAATMFDSLDKLLASRDLALALAQMERNGFPLAAQDKLLADTLLGLYHHEHDGGVDTLSYFDKVVIAAGGSTESKSVAGRARLGKIIELVGHLEYFTDETLNLTSDDLAIEDHILYPNAERTKLRLQHLADKIQAIKAIVAKATPLSASQIPMLSSAELERVTALLLAAQADYRDALGTYWKDQGKAPYNDMFVERAAEISGMPGAGFDIVLKRLGVWLSGAQAKREDPFGNQVTNRWLSPNSADSRLIAMVEADELRPLLGRLDRLSELSSALNYAASGVASEPNVDAGGSQGAVSVSSTGTLSAASGAAAMDPEIQALLKADAAMVEWAKREPISPVAYEPPLPPPATQRSAASAPASATQPDGTVQGQGNGASRADGVGDPARADASKGTAREPSLMEAMAKGELKAKDDQPIQQISSNSTQLAQVSSEPSIAEPLRIKARKVGAELMKILMTTPASKVDDAIANAGTQMKSFTKNELDSLQQVNPSIPAGSWEAQREDWTKRARDKATKDAALKEGNASLFKRLGNTQSQLTLYSIMPGLTESIQLEAQRRALALNTLLRQETPVSADDLKKSLDNHDAFITRNSPKADETAGDGEAGGASDTAGAADDDNGDEDGSSPPSSAGVGSTDPSVPTQSPALASSGTSGQESYLESLNSVQAANPNADAIELDKPAHYLLTDAQRNGLNTRLTPLGLAAVDQQLVVNALDAKAALFAGTLFENMNASVAANVLGRDLARDPTAKNDATVKVHLDAMERYKKGIAALSAVLEQKKKLVPAELGTLRTALRGVQPDVNQIKRAIQAAKEAEEKKHREDVARAASDQASVSRASTEASVKAQQKATGGEDGDPSSKSGKKGKGKTQTKTDEAG